MTNKKDLTEFNIVNKNIITTLKNGRWDIHKQIREEVYITEEIILESQQSLSKTNELLNS